MVFPFGLKDATVRRAPVVSIAISVLCLLMFLGTTAFYDPEEAFSQSGIQRVVSDWSSGIWTYDDPELPFPKACLLNQEVETAVAAVRRDARGDVATTLREMALSEDGDRPTEEEFVAQLGTGCDRAIDRLLATPIYRYGLVPAEGLVQLGLLSHMFMHAGWAHLVFNLAFFILICGPFVEDVWGRPAFALFYLLGGLVAAIAQYGLTRGSMVPMVGASGAIAAAMGAFCLRFAKRKVKFFYVIPVSFKPYVGTFAVPAWLAGLFWFGEDLVGQLWFADGSGVAYAAHLGGFAFGAAAAVASRSLGLEQRWGIACDDDYQLGQESHEKLHDEALWLGVPETALFEPTRLELDPRIRENFEAGSKAMRRGDFAAGTLRLKWLLGAADPERDDRAVVYLFARYWKKLVLKDFPFTALVRLEPHVRRHGLWGPYAQVLERRMAVEGVDDADATRVRAAEVHADELLSNTRARELLAPILVTSQEARMVLDRLEGLHRRPLEPLGGGPDEEGGSGQASGEAPAPAAMGRAAEPQVAPERPSEAGWTGEAEVVALLGVEEGGLLLEAGRVVGWSEIVAVNVGDVRGGGAGLGAAIVTDLLVREAASGRTVLLRLPWSALGEAAMADFHEHKAAAHALFVRRVLDCSHAVAVPDAETLHRGRFPRYASISSLESALADRLARGEGD